MTMADVSKAGDLVRQFIVKATNAPYIEFILGLALVMVYVVSPILNTVTVERILELGALWPLAVVASVAVAGNAAIMCVREYCRFRYHEKSPSQYHA